MKRIIGAVCEWKCGFPPPAPVREERAILEGRTGKDNYILTTIGPHDRQWEINYQEHIRALKGFGDSSLGNGERGFDTVELLGCFPRPLEIRILRHSGMGNRSFTRLAERANPPPCVIGRPIADVLVHSLFIVQVGLSTDRRPLLTVNQ